MPKLTLHIQQFNPQTQAELRLLNERLPDPLTVGSRGSECWVSYEAWFGEAQAQDEVRKALTSPELRHVTLV